MKQILPWQDLFIWRSNAGVKLFVINDHTLSQDSRLLPSLRVIDNVALGFPDSDRPHKSPHQRLNFWIEFCNRIDVHASIQFGLAA